jgi:glycosyltransferase involved in cell wall biosynthesis
MTTSRMALVVPMFNEATRFDASAWHRFLLAHPSLTLYFVNDGSTDATASHLETLAASVPGRALVIQLHVNAGKAEAVRQGMLAAFESDADLLGFVDGDLAAPLSEVLHLATELERLPDTWMALGSRVRLLGREIHRTALRHVLGRVFATAASLVLALPVYDTQCGLKVFRAIGPVRQVFQEPFLTRWLFDVELIARLARSPGDPAPALRFREVPLESWKAQEGSRLRWRDFLVAPWELWRIHLHYRKTP